MTAQQASPVLQPGSSPEKKPDQAHGMERDLAPTLRQALWALSAEERESRDTWGNAFYWATLNSPAALPAAAEALAAAKARLCMVTALTRSSDVDPVVVMEYHFAVNGGTVTVIVPLDQAKVEQREAEVPSITPWFRNADWHERECAELFGIRLLDNPNPKRLFLDDSLEEGVLKGLVPLTVMMNGACTTDLWERVMLANEETSGEKA